MWLVKAFSARARERGRFAWLLEGERTTHRDSLMYIERLRVLHDLGLWLMAGGMLAWTLYLWSEGRVSPGDVILTVAMAFRILHSQYPQSEWTKKTPYWYKEGAVLPRK